MLMTHSIRTVGMLEVEAPFIVWSLWDFMGFRLSDRESRWRDSVIVVSENKHGNEKKSIANENSTPFPHN